MPLLKSGTISKAVRVGKFVGAGFLNVLTSRGEVKMFHGDHLIEVDYTRPTRPGEVGTSLTKTHKFVVPEDAAKALGVHLKETVEEENERLALEAEQRRLAAEAAKAAAPTK